MKDQSTLQQMLVFLNSICENNKVQVGVIYLDFAKAFDHIAYNKLLLNLVYWNYQRPIVMVQVLSP